ncbi:23S rRNA (cytidine1920-2'-O)/16S rRNA (cytidine1409-2'-O)-methyltransferase [Litorivivens lipolytica]|uniref:23S rRNA (Cytidine1920-2'-O)/16S rRNA (Cytidine1409-2'-O)-methyltransferase n=1 Tax=Litorivivens lipolytica TaxID=1524264 RepID=A0A7W4Z7T5_9GAMM|nr:TlyA family RNA methyltransferase [Litorivivens lipolytica]MBB3048350.1 23S rRNA (cytidine1920-2'-O)/16S rRNA (cytidine1409-2'-O)-methyltransferase [Litorivivens lipolytica]
MGLKRADVLLVECGLAESRVQAQRWISEGKVSAGGAAVTKASQKFASDVAFTVRRDEQDRFVSRGGLKLAAALEKNYFPVTGVALDVGASTGGFTDCLLQSGIDRVVCVDVGHDQLAEKIRSDARVINYEGINARELPIELLQHSNDGFDVVVMDVSFISQTKILPGLPAFIKSGGWLVSLVKPQFEVGRDYIGKGGLVRDSSRYAIVESDIRNCAEAAGLKIVDFFDSPIEGGDGNREFLLIATRP